ncbi:MAG: squalene/phytoene synthase family protein [Rhodospirillales bacterium]|nr:squalene/phytoene synthase family protein [Rhodospirillales bacterium]
MAQSRAMAELSPIAQRVRREDRDRFLCALFAPPDKREALFALYALDLELSAIPGKVSEDLLGEMRFQFWRETIEGIYAGEIRRHEVVEPLAAAIGRFDLEREPFDVLIDTRARDLKPRPSATRADFMDYLEGTAGIVSELSLHVLGVRDQTSNEVAGRVAMAWAMARLLGRIPQNASRGRQMLPDDELRAAGVDFAQGGRGEALNGFVADWVACTDLQMALARTRKQDIDARAMPVLLLSQYTRKYSKRLRAQKFDPFARDVLRPWAMAPLVLWWKARQGVF